jgi:hypothetical protein
MRETKRSDRDLYEIPFDILNRLEGTRGRGRPVELYVPKTSMHKVLVAGVLYLRAVW